MLGMSHVKLGEYNKAKECYERALQLYKDENQISIVLELLGRHSEAKRLSDKIKVESKETWPSIAAYGALHLLRYVIPEEWQKQYGQGMLELRIAPNHLLSSRSASPLTTDQINRWTEQLKKDGPVLGKELNYEYLWYKVKGDVSLDFLVSTELHNDKYLLVHNRKHYFMYPKQGWGLQKTYITQDNKGKPAVEFWFDERGSELFYELTKENIGQALAIIIDGEVFSTPVIQSALRNKAIITGNFTQKEAEKLTENLRKGMPPVVSKPDVQVEGESRVLHFPVDRSLGKLHVQDTGTIETPTHWWWGLNTQWQYLAEAKGDVTVPAGKRLGLIVGQDGRTDLSPLAKLGPDDLYMLTTKGAGDDCMTHISRLTGLKELILQDTGITNEGLRLLNRLKSLERLSFASKQLDDSGMAHIAELKSLKGLRFYSEKVTNDGLSHLSKLTLLEELFPSSRGGVDDEGLVHLTKLPALRYLLLAIGDFTENGLVHLKDIPSLRKLDVGCIEFSSEGLAHISRIPGLEDLTISHTVLSNEDLIPLKSMSSLKRLRLQQEWQQMGPDFTDEGLAHLSEVKSLESLLLYYGNFTDKGLEYLSQLRKLKRLEIPNNTGFTDAGLGHLTKLRLLEELMLRANQFTDAGMVSVAKLTNLKRLRLWVKSNITNNGLAYLTNLNKLSYLRINGDFTDEGLTHVGSLDKLDYLEISGDFTDAGLHHLEGLKLLTRLKIRSRNELSPQALQALHSKLPNLRTLN
jgi:hypothetical protein